MKLIFLYSLMVYLSVTTLMIAQEDPAIYPPEFLFYTLNGDYSNSHNYYLTSISGSEFCEDS